jgi:ankyrin repeat protein
LQWAGAVLSEHFRDKGFTRVSDAFSLCRQGVAAAGLTCALCCSMAMPAGAQDIERFFTNPRLADKSAAKATTDALELSKDQALWTAIAFEDPEQLRQLLKRGANPNKPEELSLMTPLMAAETLPVTWALLEAGADPRARDRTGKTALHYAVKMRDGKTIIQLLVRAGAEINARAEEPGKTTPLFSAVENYLETPEKKNAEEIIRTLVELGADINAADGKGMTVLAMAIASNHQELVKILVELGANPA